MGEIDFYPELCTKIEQYLRFYLPIETKIEYAFNKHLLNMVTEIDEKIGQKSEIAKDYLPLLKLDILFGIKLPDEDTQFILFEVKYSNQLTLADVSQLIGYLQVAKNIEIGVLLLVVKTKQNNMLSNDFSEIVQMRNLPMEWQVLLQEKEGVRRHNFEIGICNFVPNNGIDWLEIKGVKGLKNFKDISDKILGFGQRL
jgi:hypothetical protein